MKTGLIWTYHQEKQLRQLVAGGASVRSVAEVLPFSIGTIQRRAKKLGLVWKGRRPKPPGARPVKPQQPPAPPVSREDLNIAMALAFSQARSIPLMVAGAQDCRWPVDTTARDPHCCGDQITRDPYCAEHGRRAYSRVAA